MSEVTPTPQTAAQRRNELRVPARQDADATLIALRAKIEQEIEAIKACPYCGGESEGDRGRITALRWALANSSAATKTAREAIAAEAVKRHETPE